MIFTLNTLVDFGIVFVIWRIYAELVELRRTTSLDALHTLSDIRGLKLTRVNLDPIRGAISRLEVKSSIAEKTADRAFNMASAANLGVVALQKSLATPRIMTKAQVQQNQLAKNGVDKLFTTEGKFDLLRPVLSPEDNDLLDSIEEFQAKVDMRKQG